ncbi:MAG: SUMF1/EgtB/PvdO family nonheme iron enzyme [Flavobacteriaceae bacterium]|nr:SUMF1/EgtB/PvdO family nonheme iron enzyme [Flavobacteriaceae bacterium]
MKPIGLTILLTALLIGCSKRNTLEVVTVADFESFVNATGYETDAERYGWSFVQEDVLTFTIVEAIDWRSPRGEQHAPSDMPVTQVSFNDALAYCEWSKSRLPTYEEYWELVTKDRRPMIIDQKRPAAALEAHTIGNVWELTTSENQKGEIRLAGGSYLCSQHTCDGSNPDRKLFVDKSTGNSHIGFAVVR